MLELAILGLLIESPMHGYELRKRLTGLLGAFRAFSYGSLYPALRRMQADLNAAYALCAGGVQRDGNAQQRGKLADTLAFRRNQRTINAVMRLRR